MNRKIVLIVFAVTVIVVLSMVVGLYLAPGNAPQPKQPVVSKPVQTTTSTELPEITTPDITQTATQGALPTINTNPLESKPDLNPADKANPFSDIETNPFK